MRKKLILPALLLVVSVFWVQSVKAITNEEMEGSPDQNEDHFVWDIMSQLQTPDDPDCSTVAQATLIAEGIEAGEAADISIEACSGLASMRTDMQGDMNSGGEGIETNLWDATNWHAVENLYFAHSTDGVSDGRIAFSQPIDFMSYAFMNFMTNFGNNMDTDEGYISLDADVVGGFADYGATLTMYNVPEFDDPVILVDGEQDTEGIVSNLVYNSDDNTLTFSAAHFSSFEAVESSSLTPRINKVKAKRYINRSGKERIKVTIYGKRFKSSSVIEFGSKDAYKVRKKSSKKLIAYFKTSDLRKHGRRFYLKVSNGDYTKKYKKKKFRINKLDWLE